MKLLLTIVFYLIATFAKGQDSKFLDSKPRSTNFIKYPSDKRLSFYPFSKTRFTKLVSFGWQYDTSSARSAFVYSIPLANDTIILSKLEKVVALNPSELDSLTGILFNECSRWNITTITEMGCYFPRNAIVFYDYNEKPFEYLEICFQCNGFKSSNVMMEQPDKCDAMFTALKAFFSNHGVKTNVTELIMKSNKQ